jgi:hypothetical protein
MMRRLAWFGCFVLLAGAALAQDDAALRDDLRMLVREGPGSDEGRAAWRRVSGAGPEALVPLLEAMRGQTTATSNWLRTAFDRIADRERTAGGKRLDADRLLAFVKDASNAGRARRLALELVESLRPGTSASLYPGWLDDPEFRYEAVDELLKRSRELAKAGPRDEATKSFRRALDASRDLAQARAAAAGLLQFGIKTSVAEHLGFLTDWYVVGPFDGKGMKGFHVEYPPERKVDLSEELAGQNGKVRWKRYTVQEPPPTAGGRHQALVNLREKNALGDADDAVAFAYTEFAADRADTVEFRGAADDNLTVWVNGQKAFAFEEWRNGVRHDRHRFKAPLVAGKNTVLVKVCQTPAPNPEPNWEFFLRVVDETGKGIKMRNLLPPR